MAMKHSLDARGLTGVGISHLLMSQSKMEWETQKRANGAVQKSGPLLDQSRLEVQPYHLVAYDLP